MASPLRDLLITLAALALAILMVVDVVPTFIEQGAYPKLFPIWWLAVGTFMLWLAYAKGIVLGHQNFFTRAPRGRLWPWGIYRDEDPARFRLFVRLLWIFWITGLVLVGMTLFSSGPWLPLPFQR